jgi:hypothetical protein
MPYAHAKDSFLEMMALGHSFPLVYLSEKGFFLSRDCWKRSPNHPQCQAYQAYERKVKSKTSGEAVCIEHSAQILIALDERQNQTALCLFKDQSVIDLRALGQ